MRKTNRGSIQMIGIVVDEINNDPKSYVMFRELNKISGRVPCFVFTNGIRGLPMKNEFTILQQIEALSHQGTLIGTSIMSSQIVAKSLTARKKLLYMWDLEWSKLENFHASQVQSLFLNKELDVIARSDKHKEVFSKLYKNTDKVIYNWRAEELLKVI